MYVETSSRDRGDEHSPHKMKKLLSVAVIALCAQVNAPAHGFVGFRHGVPSAYTYSVEEAEGAGNAQRWLLCLMLSDGLINSETADKAVSLISEFNYEVFTRYAEDYGKRRYDSYDFAWTSASVGTNEYDSQCEKIKRPKPVYSEQIIEWPLR